MRQIRGSLMSGLLSCRGILWKQYADDVQIVGHTGGLGAWCGEKLALFRENACGQLEKLFDPDTAGLLQAMLLV